jgi:tetratricopeptide (TPR) repeat protein
MVFMLFLAPTLGVTDIYFMRFSLVADHWTYLALPALLAVLVSLGGQLPIGRALKLGVGWLLILTAIGLCRERSLAFVDEETLWRDTIRKNPAAWMAWDNLAAALERAGRRDEAKDAFREAIRRAPSEPSPRMHLGMCLAARGQLREALAVYGETERMERRVAGLHHWTAAAHERLGELDQAEHHYREEVRARPTFAAPRIALGEFLARRRRFPEALREFEKAVRLEPRDRTAADRLAVLIRLIDADPSPSAPIPGATAPR